MLPQRLVSIRLLVHRPEEHDATRHQNAADHEKSGRGVARAARIAAALRSDTVAGVIDVIDAIVVRVRVGVLAQCLNAEVTRRRRHR